MGWGARATTLPSFSAMLMQDDTRSGIRPGPAWQSAKPTRPSDGADVFERAGEQMATYTLTSGADTLVEGDVNGDGVADLQIVLTGARALTAADFGL